MVEKSVITVSGFDKDVLGQFAANVRKVKKPEPYKGKGIRYQGELLFENKVRRLRRPVILIELWKNTVQKTKRVSRHKRIRAKVSGSASRPRLAIFRSNRFVYAQLIDDTSGKTLAAVDTRSEKKRL